MADILSNAANILATIGFSAGFSSILYQVISSIQSAPQEVHKLASELEALSAAFAGIEIISRDLPSHNALSGEFISQLRSCIADLDDLERTVRRLEKSLRQNFVKKSLARIQWQYNEPIAIQFARRVQLYHVTLSLALTTLQIKLGVTHQSSLDSAKAGISSFYEIQRQQLILNQKFVDGLQMLAVRSQRPRGFLNGATPHSQLQSTETIGNVRISTFPENRESTTTCIGSGYKKEPSPLVQINSTPIRQESHIEPVSIRAAILYQGNTRFIKVTLWRGPLLVRRWHKSQQPTFEQLQQSEGYGVGVSFAFPNLQLKNATFMASFLKGYNKSRMRTTVHWNLSLPAVVNRDSEIMEFASLGNLDAIIKLFKSGRAKPTDVAPNGDSLLHVAVRHNHLEVCRWLLEQGADVNAADEDMDTPLHVAVSTTRNYDIVRLLIQSGADPGNCNVSGDTPLHTPFNDTVHQLLLYHSDTIETNARNSRGMILLHFFTQSSQSSVDTVKRLVERGCPSDVVLKDYRGRSALHLAAQRGNVAVISYLLGLGAHVDARCRDGHGRTALHYAVESRRTETIRIMIGQGADVRVKDHSGRSVLHHAAWRRNLEAMKYLLESGITDDLVSRDIDGKTPLDLAIEEGATEVVEFLRNFVVNCAIRVEQSHQYRRSRVRCESKRTTIKAVDWLGCVGLIVLTMLCFYLLFFLQQQG